MTKDELVNLLKEYKENKAKLKLRCRDIKKYKKELKELEIQINTTSSYEINSDIRSKNKISNKVENAILHIEEKREGMKEKIKETGKEIAILKDKVEEAEIRLESLYYKEREILTAYYVDNRTSEDISQNLYWELYKRTCSIRHIQNLIKRATDRMLKL